MREQDKGGMSGLALLCFLGHGETPESPQYGLTVNKAVQWFLDNGTKHQGRLHMAGAFSNHGVYEHGMATYALGEYFTMTKDERVLELLKQSVEYIVQGQQQGGGWDYSYNQSGRQDLSVSGWQIQALKAAHLTQLNLPGVDEALKKSMKFISSFKGPNGGYGYEGAVDNYSLTGVGILSSLSWKGNREELRKGMEWLLDETEGRFPVKYRGADANLYAWYYDTQACLMFGGNAWTKWNRWFQDEIVGAQHSDGSWPVPGGTGFGGWTNSSHIGVSGFYIDSYRTYSAPEIWINLVTQTSLSGEVERTTLCVLMLEVFYRYIPTTQQ